MKAQERAKQKKEQYEALMAQLLQDPKILALVKAKMSNPDFLERMPP